MLRVWASKIAAEVPWPWRQRMVGRRVSMYGVVAWGISSVVVVVNMLRALAHGHTGKGSW